MILNTTVLRFWRVYKFGWYYYRGLFLKYNVYPKIMQNSNRVETWFLVQDEQSYHIQSTIIKFVTILSKQISQLLAFIRTSNWSALKTVRAVAISAPVGLQRTECQLINCFFYLSYWMSLFCCKSHFWAH